MDGRDMESDFGLPDGFAWLHELLRNANGVTVAGDGASLVPERNPQERNASRLDRPNFSEQEGTRYSSSLAEATKSIRKLDVRPFPGRGSGRFCLAHMGGHATVAYPVDSGRSRCSVS